jgi:hypothetical protein
LNTNNSSKQHYIKLISDKKIFVMPDFLKSFFFLLRSPETITENEIYKVCIKPFLLFLPDYKIELNKINQLNAKSKKPLPTFKTYLYLAQTNKLSDPTIAYKIFKNMFITDSHSTKKYYYSPFGYNAFFKFKELLTENDVFYPEALS